VEESCTSYLKKKLALKLQRSGDVEMMRNGLDHHLSSSLKMMIKIN
jgi:hypothetical protein